MGAWRRRALCSAVASCFVAVASQAADTRAAWLRTYRCPLNHELKAVYERPAGAAERDRFTVLRVAKAPQRFVQCVFAESRRKLICEAPTGGRRTNVAALAQLGFVAMNDKMFIHRRDLPDRPDFDAIATFMLIVLLDGYGVDENTDFTTTAPYRGSIVTACLR